MSDEIGTLGIPDWLQLLSSTLVGVFSLVGVSAEFGNLGEMLIG